MGGKRIHANAARYGDARISLSKIGATARPFSTAATAQSVKL